MAPTLLSPSELYPYPDKLDYSRQAVEVPGTRKPGQTGAFAAQGVEKAVAADSM
jgi:hypothetical protein